MIARETQRAWLELSFAQRAVWLDVRTAAADSSYVLVSWARLTGELDPELCRQALTLVAARHDALRLRIDIDAPRQWLHTAADVPFSCVDLSAQRDPEAALARHVERALATGLPLGDRALFDVELIRLGARDSYLLVRCHHLLADEAGLAMVLNHWLEAYLALTSEGAPELSPPSSYLPVIAADKTYAESARYTADLDYWTSRFASLSPPLLQPRNAGGDAAPATPNAAAAQLDGERYVRFAAASKEAGVAPQRVIFALLAVVLGRRYGQSDVTLGMALHRRDAANMHVVGMLAGMIAVRLSLDGTSSLLDAVRAAGDRIDADLRHARLPIDALSRALEISRTGLSALFSVAVSFVPAQRAARDVQPDDLTCVVGTMPTAEASPLSVHAKELAGGRGIAIDFAADPRFMDADEVRRLMQLFTAAVDRFIEEPDAVLESLAATTPAEYEHVTSGCNATAAVVPDLSADACFALAVRAHSNAPAVVGADQTLTYGELAARSDELARVLAGRGVRRHTIVGVALERSVSTVVTLLAILKADAIYLPLDPAYPPDRIAHMIADSRASIVVTDATHSALLPAGVERLFIDERSSGEPQADAERPGHAPPPAGHTPDDAAYIIYTSGSTGRPKGVAVPHHAAVNLAFARLAHDPIGPGDRILAAISVGFDVSIGQLLLPLLSGAAIVIAPDVRTQTPREFWDFLTCNGVTHVNSVPSFFESILDAAPPAPGLVRLMLGGEPLTAALVRRLRAALPTTCVVNMYGPTEACIDATAYVAGETEPVVLPIGKPLPNYRAYILDARLEPAGIGVAGDLYLGGAGLAHGYLNAPALTARRFIADPFGTRGERLYQTGDRARRRSDGNIEFLGRADTQVKIRGHRVELGEIEAQLLQLDGVRETAVILRADDAADERLVAYYTAETPLPPQTLRARLESVLPGYMIPAAYVHLAALPLTPNGKVDRSVLPAPRTEAYPLRAFEPPAGEAETRIAEILAAVLGAEGIGRHENFFERGGHSLSAMAAIEKLRGAGLRVDVRAFFDAPTVAGLAGAARSASAEAAVPPNRIVPGTTSIEPGLLPLVQLTQGEIDAVVARVPGGAPNIADIYPLAPLQEGILFRHLMSDEGDAYLTPFLIGFDSRGRLESFLDALREIVGRHDILRTAIVWEPLSRPVQVVVREARLPVEDVVLDGAPAADAARQLLERFDPRHFRIEIGRAPMLRACIAHDAQNERWLLLLMSHHLILDHASLEVILHEIRLISSGRRAALPDVKPFRNFIAQTANGIQLHEHEAFFRAMLGDVDEPTAPYGLTQLAGDGSGIGESSLALDAALAERLRSRARALGVSPATIFHLAWALVLAHAAGRRDVVFGTLLFGRMNGGDGSLGTPGMYINTLPLRIAVDGASAESAVLRTHAALAELLQHEHASLALAQRCSGVAAPAPLFSALLNFRHSPPADPDAVWPGVDFLFMQERTDYPLALAVDDRTRDFLITAQSDAPVDAAAVCRSMHAAVTNLLAALEFAPQTEIRALSVLGADDYAAVTAGCNATAAIYPDRTADECFALAARQHPDAAAVVSANGALRYAELDRRSDEFARALIGRGVRPQSVVGVALERSAATVTSLLAILKAGAIYLPLDPAYPPDRLAHMIADSRASIVITDIANATVLPAHVERLLIDGASPTGGGRATPLPPRSHAPADTAYIIYTSGSTGRPKGVAVSHRAAVNLGFARLAHDPIGPGDRIAAAISVGFDVSIGQLLLPLFAGATIVIAGDVRTQSAQEFWDFLGAQAVTHINSVPSFFESILDAAPPASSLVRLMLGGEPLSAALVRRLRTALPGTHVVNMYGPTEACIDATFYLASGDETLAVLPIGKPLPNYRAYVLDARLEPAGIGVAGDLYLGGAGLAQGYVNAPGLTAERFIADPFGNGGERLYATGDRARRRADGSIEFLGRADTQVKIRGHRIELGEIEAALRRHPGVAQTAVIAAPAASGPARLVAYVVGDADANLPCSAELRGHLADLLPDYMLPAAYVGLDALPLTANGKLDLRALPPVAWESVSTHVAPGSATEKLVAACFGDILGVTNVGAADSFFALGGHSLLATRLVSQLRSRHTVAVPMRAVFDFPTVAGLARYIDGIQRDDADVALRIERPEQLPLSFTQERLWFLTELQKDDAYNVPIAVRLRGDLDIGRLGAALGQIVERHEALRTCIAMHDGRPVQRIMPPERFALGLTDLTGLGAAEQAAALAALLHDRASRTFDLAVDLPISADVIDLAPDDHAVVVVIHHASFDGWSAGLFVTELAQRYAADSAERAAPAAPALQYADFAVWQRGRDFAADLDYWRRRLAGAPPVLTFPADAPPASDGRRATGIVPLALDAALVDALMRIANANGASMFILLHAALAALLARWSGQFDVVIGTVVANRTRAEFESIVGCFVNTLALRTTLDPQAGFAALLAAVRDADLEAYEHAEVPFEKVVDAVAPERSLHHTPLFQVLFVLDDEPLPDVGFPGLTLEPLALEPGAAKFDLALSLGRRAADGALTGALEYAADVHAAATMERFAAQFARLLGAVAADPQLAPLRTDLLAPAERIQIVDEWNATSAAFPSGTLDAFVAQRARECPQAPAVICGTQTLTYAQLDARADGLAHALRARGVPAQSVVGVALERSAGTIVALLGILKAGCIYLPLDPVYPVDRIAYMLADSRAALVVTDDALAAALPADIERLLIDDATATPTAGPAPWSHGPGDTAYVIYTSGSTGKPKGVAVAHAAAVNLAFARRTYDPLGPGDRMLAGASVGFDTSLEQLLLPLLSGAAVVVAGDLRTYTPAAFWTFLAAHGVTSIDSVPSFFDSVADAAPDSVPLVRLMLGGEPLTAPLLRRLRRALPRTKIFNLYGPTEACIDATAFAATDCAAANVPIGKPLPNYRAYILDAQLEPVAVGIAGDLYLAGAGLAQGYVNASGLTAERFIADPFGARGTRMYKTGDRARYLPDGDIEFLGRADAQVKLRGHRIELGEIEAQLASHPGVREARVIVREDAPGDQRLVAYYIASETPAADALRAALSKTLPVSMVPAAYVRIAALPLTANGKLDRKALPMPGAGAYTERAFALPVGAAETQIAQVFADVLALDRVGRHDNFFELGGHSLLSMTVIERLRTAGLRVDVRQLFTHPTVAALAAAAALDIDERIEIPPNRIARGSTTLTPELLPLVTLRQAEIDTIVAAVPGGAANIQDIYPLAPLQEGILFRHVLTPAGDAYLTPVLLAFDGRDRLERFLAALREMIARHDILRTAVLWEHLPAPVQVVVRDAELPIEEVTLDPESALDAAAQLRDRYDPQRYRLDVRRAPMVLAALAHDARNERWLLMLLNHHLTLDHASLEVILHEIGLIAAGRRDALAEPVPFRNFVAQTKLGIPAHEHEAFFRAMLADVDEPTLPFGMDAVQGDGSGIREFRLTVDASLTSRLRARARSLGVGPATLFHLAWALVLAHVSGRTDVVFGTLLLGRMYGGEGAQRTLGMFINTLPVRVCVDAAGVEAAVLRTHRMLAGVLRHEHASLALAQRCSGVPAPAPLFSALFNFRHNPGASADGADARWPGVEVLFAQERTDYPVALAVDDRPHDFLITAQTDAGIEPERLCRSLTTALDNLVAALDTAPLTKLAAVSVVPAAEAEALTAACNDTAAGFPAGTADRFFARAVQAAPDALAVVGADEMLTYAELDARSDRLARTLADCGVQPRCVVGVALERSPATVVALLAILKAGGIYLPLDPAYPPERLAYMIADARTRLVVTDAAISPLLPGGVQRVFIDAASVAVEAADVAALHLAAGGRSEFASALPDRGAADPAEIAYIIYTSGSTGKPKGVAVSHAAVVNLAFARLRHDPIGPGDRILAAISVGFDVSIGQLLLPLLNGATIVIAGDVRTLTPREFWRFLGAHRVTHINSVPSFFESILDAAPPASTLVRLMLGGEALTPALVRRLRAALPATHIVNMYGPTEACIDATCYIADGTETAATLPIGKPLPNYRAYVLDALLEPVPIGVAGELYLGGAGLAQGYLNAPGLTAERFVPDPFGTAGGRLYKTGDRARRLADGNIEFLGRTDAQVKLRGHRIELGEIETRLALLEGVREAAVIVREDGGDPRLVAYYTAGEPLAADGLRAALSAALPDYMLPAAYVRLATLPLTMNGKLDRKALPPPGAQAYAALAFEAPAGEIEARIAGLFGAALNADRVGRHDNFFALGGHSLLAMSVVEQIRQTGLSIDVRDVFRAPTPAGLAAAAVQVLPRAPAIPPNLIAPGTQVISPAMLPLVQLGETEIAAIAASVPGGAANVQDIYPLAPLQEGLLFRHLLSGAGDPYVIPTLLAFDCRARLDAFLDAVREMIARHDILRTAVRWEGLPRAVQVVVREAVLSVEVVGIDDAGAADAAQQLRERYDPHHFRVDVRQAPMLRAFVARDARNDRWLLMLVSHHLILDGASVETIMHEFVLISSGRRAALAPPVPFRNFVAQALAAGAAEEREAFFRALLGDVDEPTAPYGLLEVGGDGSGIREARVLLDGELSARLRAAARSANVVPATLFHLAWALVLAHAAGRNDVVFGTVLFGRMHGGENARRTLGMFINTLPVRLTIDGSDVRGAVDRTHRLLADLLRHEHAPLALAQRCSGVAAPAPLFSALFNFRQGGAPDPHAASAVMSGIELLFSQDRTDYPLALAVDDRSTDFALTVQADAPVDPAAVCRSMETALAGTIAALETAPQTPLRSIAVMPRSEYERVTRTDNDTAAGYPNATLHGLVAEQTLRTPHGVAVTGGALALTYAELDARAGALAHRLAARGVSAGTVVGVALERSVSSVVALLAILKTSGVYLPLDPAYPPERLAYMIADAGARLAIADAGTAGLLPPALELVRIDEEAGSPAAPAMPVSPPDTCTPGDTAYIIYTSGSTGKPKGVAVSHAAAVNLAFARLRHDPIGPDDRILAAISVGFDVSIGQLLLPLLSGATVVVAGDLRALTPAEFWEFLAARQVTHINSVPSFFESILHAAPRSSTLVRLMLGGEALSAELVRRLRAALPDVQIVNMYGPTEACIDALCYVANGAEAGATLPIGKPLPNYRAYILDARLEPVGVGVAGELYLGGAGLAQAYVNAAALTAERFVADPFDAAGGRLYKTGDRARRLADGNIEFLGRADAQIKIRGHRVELGEIEAQLALHDAIAQAAVVAVTGTSGPVRLVAFVVPHPAGAAPPPAAVELRAFLAGRLPDYMLPAAYVTVSELPLTPNGKLDRKALQSQPLERDADVPFEPPQTPAESRLQHIFQTILGVEAIGRHDDFFALGGHSLAAMRLIAECNAAFATRLPLRAIFSGPTIAQLATVLESTVEAPPSALIALRSTGTRPPLFCIHPAGGHVFGYAPLVKALDAGTPVYGLAARALEDGGALAGSIAEMAADYIGAIRAVAPGGPYQLLGMSSGGLVAFEIAQQLRGAGERVGLLALLDTTVPDAASGAFTERDLMRGVAAELGIEDLILGAAAMPATSAELLARAFAAGRLPRDIDAAFVERVAAVYRNTVRLCAAYRPAPWNGPLLLLRAMRRDNAGDAPPDWSAYARGEARTIDLDCTHTGLMSTAFAPSIASYIEPLLEQETHGRI